MLIREERERERKRERESMGGDWGPVVIGAVLFVLLTPGLLFQIPAKESFVRN